MFIILSKFGRSPEKSGDLEALHRCYGGNDACTHGKADVKMKRWKSSICKSTRMQNGRSRVIEDTKIVHIAWACISMQFNDW